MRTHTRNELNKLRELTHFLLIGLKCVFCKASLLSEEDLVWNTHGNAVGPRFTAKISIHHLDGNHENNVHENKGLCHRRCHKKYHLVLRRQESDLRKALELQSAENPGEIPDASLLADPATEHP